ncbi:MAG: YibE/F family protein [Patescibacteria group bacterium]
MKRFFAGIFLIIFLLVFCGKAFGATLLTDKVEIVKAKVENILNEEKEILPGTSVTGLKQTLQIQILEGSQTGKTITIENDYIKLSEGEIFYLNHTTRAEDGVDTYIVSDAYRLPALYFFALLFILLVLLIGGMQGLRGLLSLAGSMLLIVFVLLPAVLAGYSPIFVAIGVSSLIIILGSYITHGFNKTTTSAVLGMIFTVIITGILANFAVHFAKFTGMGSEEAVYLNFNLEGHIDILGVLLGGIMIGVLGVLYDVSIGQAISVEELHKIAPDIERKKIFARAIRIGREHIGALVNTLAIAYVGAALPLLLLFFSSSSSVAEILNREIFSTEIIRILIGSIGLVLAVPITTFISVLMLV